MGVPEPLVVDRRAGPPAAVFVKLSRVVLTSAGLHFLNMLFQRIVVHVAILFIVGPKRRIDRFLILLRSRSPLVPQTVVDFSRLLSGSVFVVCGVPRSTLPHSVLPLVAPYTD